MKTNLFDKNKKEIKIGDVLRLTLEDGEVRDFTVEFKTVIRTVKCHPDFDDEYTKVAITGIVFSWDGYSLFPCVDENGISDVNRMEIISSVPFSSHDTVIGKRLEAGFHD